MSADLKSIHARSRSRTLVRGQGMQEGSKLIHASSRTPSEGQGGNGESKIIPSQCEI